MSICFDNAAGLADNAGASGGFRAVLCRIRGPEMVMTDVSQTEALCAVSLPGQTTDHLSVAALACAAAQDAPIAGDVNAQIVQQLQQAVAAGAPGDGPAIVRRLVANGIRPEDIADHYIPAVARKLGELWCEDEIGFATVTIGSARLQGLLRDLEEMASSTLLATAEGAALLVVVAAETYHTLGAMVLTGQLRRRGHAVRLLLGVEPEAVATAVRQARFDAVLVSAPQGAPVEGVRRIVMAVKTATGAPPQVVVGGTLIGSAAVMESGILRLTGADHATSDPETALRLCGLTANAGMVTGLGQGH